MKHLLKISILSTFFVLASCAHNSSGCSKCCDSQCEMHKDGSKDQCNMKHDSKHDMNDMKKEEAAPAVKK